MSVAERIFITTVHAAPITWLSFADFVGLTTRFNLPQA